MIKDPDATLDYLWDWSGWLPSGDTITAVEVLAEGVTVDGYSHDGATVTVWLTGGVVETTARATVRVTTAQGRTDDRTLTLLVRER